MIVLAAMRWMVMGLFAWMALSHGLAFWRTRRLIYALLGLSGLAFIGGVALHSLLSGGGDVVSSLPLFGTLAFVLIQAATGRPRGEFREYASPRAVLLFRKPLAEPLPDERFAAEAPAPQPPSRQIWIMTVVMLAGMAVIASVF